MFHPFVRVLASLLRLNLAVQAIIGAIASSPAPRAMPRELALEGGVGVALGLAILALKSLAH
jgi:hypothetical protein